MDTTPIKLVMNTMNEIEVKGIENMRMFLGCYELLGQTVQMAEAPNPAENQEASNG